MNMKKTFSILLVLILVFMMGTPALAKPVIAKTTWTRISLYALWLEGTLEEPERAAVLTISTVEDIPGQTGESLTVSVTKLERLADPPDPGFPYAVRRWEAQIPLSALSIRQKPVPAASLDRELEMAMVELDQMGEPTGEPVLVSARIKMAYEAKETDISTSSSQTQIGNYKYMVRSESVMSLGIATLDFTHNDTTDHYAAKPFDPSIYFTDSLELNRQTIQEIIH